MDLSIRNVVETINSVAPDGLLDKSANLELFHIDLDPANKSATESLQKKKKFVNSRKAHKVYSLTMCKTLNDSEDYQQSLNF